MCCRTNRVYPIDEFSLADRMTIRVRPGVVSLCGQE
jgi:hypothetical protein